MKTRLFIFLLFLSLAFPFVTQAATDEAETIVKVVSTFYKKYINADKASDSTYNWRKQPEIDPVFVKKIDALFDEAEEDEDGARVLEYDPILVAQD